MSAPATPVALVLYCLDTDAETGTCTQEAWLPAPSLLPPLSPVGAAAILSASAVLLATAWGVKHLNRTIRS